MVVSDEFLHKRMLRFAATLKPEYARDILAAWEVIRQSISPTFAASLMAAGTGIERLVQSVLTQNMEFDQAFARLSASLARGSATSAERFVIALPKEMQVFGVFDTLNPKVIEAVGLLQARVINRLSTEVAAVLNQHVRAGIEAGHSGVRIARGMRDVVGLTPFQNSIILNYDEKLRRVGQPIVRGEGFTRGEQLAALDNELRDRRFDRTVQRGVREGTRIPSPQRKNMVDAYRRRLIAHNAETHAISATNQTQKLGARLSWEDAIRRGDVKRAELFKRWDNSGDDRVRPLHVAVNGETVGFDQPYSTGEIVAGESEFRCRCIDVFFTKDQADILAVQRTSLEKRQRNIVDARQQTVNLAEEVTP